MFDTMKVTKIAAGLCGTWLVLLLAKWGASELYATGSHGDEAGYQIEVAAADAASDEPQMNIMDMMETAEADAGSNVFRKCGACHKLDGSDGVGPHLNGVVGRAIGSASGYAYSSAMADFGGEWTVEQLDGFLADPKGYIQGTKMSFAGINSVEDRANLIKYLQSTDG